jgi:hypothetical protein
VKCVNLTGNRGDRTLAQAYFRFHVFFAQGLAVPTTGLETTAQVDFLTPL